MPDLNVIAVKYSWHNLHKSSIPQNWIEFDNDARVCSIFIRGTVKQGRSLTRVVSFAQIA